MQRKYPNSIKSKSVVMLVYKNKVLLYSEETLYAGTKKNIWSFLDKSKLVDLRIKKAELEEVEPSLFCIKMSDQNVNDLIRQNGLLLEFYTFKELITLSLSYESMYKLENYKETMRNILGGRV